MADVNLPSIAELGQMEFMSPMAFQQAQKQMDLANLFQQQNLRTGEEDFKTKQLANQYSTQANPLRLDKLALDNAFQTSENLLKDIDAKQRKELAPQELEAKRQKMLTELDENKLRQFMSRAEWEMTQDDPALRASGLKKIMASKAEFDRRNKQKDELEKVAAQGQNSKDVANIQAGATLGAARIGADSRRAIASSRAKGAMDFDAAVMAGKITPEKAMVYWANQAQKATDPEEQAQAMSEARRYEQVVMNIRSAANQGKIDPGAATGLPTQQLTPAMVPQAPPKAAPAASGRIPVVSPDGKMGSIPADQLDAAIKAGYKKR